jgi:hypothetical protein
MKTATKTSIAITLTLAAAFVGGSRARAEELPGEREKARRELAQYFRKQVAIESRLVRSVGPEWTEELFKKKLIGCPDQPLAPAEPTKNITFRTGKPGPWAGAIDGINIKITSPDGTQGGSLAIPSNSTARLPGEAGGSTLMFFFDATLNVRRALVDAAAAEFDRCFQNLAPGRYDSEDLQRLCPYRRISRAEQKQTCVVSTDGIIGKPLLAGSGFELHLTESTLCDFVGYGRSGDTNTGFTRCFSNEYKGVATLSSDVIPPTAQQVQLRTAKKRMVSMCASRAPGRRMRPSRVRSCVMREMAKVMATR